MYSSISGSRISIDTYEYDKNINFHYVSGLRPYWYSKYNSGYCELFFNDSLSSLSSGLIFGKRLRNAQECLNSHILLKTERQNANLGESEIDWNEKFHIETNQELIAKNQLHGTFFTRIARKRVCGIQRLLENPAEHTVASEWEMLPMEGKRSNAPLFLSKLE